MKEFFIHHKKTVIIICAVIIILTAAFFVTDPSVKTGRNNTSLVSQSSALPVESSSGKKNDRQSSPSQESLKTKEAPSGEPSSSSTALQSVTEKNNSTAENLTSEQDGYNGQTDHSPDSVESSALQPESEETKSSTAENTGEDDADNIQDSETASPAYDDYVSVPLPSVPAAGNSSGISSPVSDNAPENTDESIIKPENIVSSAESSESTSEITLPETTSGNESSAQEENTSLCRFGISCQTLLDNMDSLRKNKRSIVPSDGIIRPSENVLVIEGESVFDLTKRVCRSEGIPFEFTITPIYNTAYVEGIYNLYEFDCGSGSGWIYTVNGVQPSVGCSDHYLHPGDVVQWHYTCALGNDIPSE